MSRKSIFLASQKKSEYRQNFLPFDYYDFCITAKENENLRYRNKLRDYLHTPFDWDEDLDIYIEPIMDNLNQSTQTNVSRSKSFNELKNFEDIAEFKRERQRVLDESNNTCEIHKHIKQQSKAQKPKKAKKNKAVKKQVPKLAFIDSPTNDTRDNGIEISVRDSSVCNHSPKKPVKRTQSAIVKNSKAKLALNSPTFAEKIQIKKTGNFELLRNSSNMSVQTPPDWNLRQYSNRNASKQSNQSKKSYKVDGASNCNRINYGVLYKQIDSSN